MTFQEAWDNLTKGLTIHDNAYERNIAATFYRIGCQEMYDRAKQILRETLRPCVDDSSSSPSSSSPTPASESGDTLIDSVDAGT